MTREINLQEAVALINANKYNYVWDSTIGIRGTGYPVNLHTPVATTTLDSFGLADIHLNISNLNRSVPVQGKSLIKIEQDSTGINFFLKSRSANSQSGVRRVRVTHYTPY